MAGRINPDHRIWAAPLLGKKGRMAGQGSRALEERSSWGRGHHKPGQQGPAWPRHCEHSGEAFHHQTLFLSRMLECSCETTGRIQGYYGQDTSGVGLDTDHPSGCHASLAHTHSLQSWDNWRLALGISIFSRLRNRGTWRFNNGPRSMKLDDTGPGQEPHPVSTPLHCSPVSVVLGGMQTPDLGCTPLFLVMSRTIMANRVDGGRTGSQPITWPPVTHFPSQMIPEAAHPQEGEWAGGALRAGLPFEREHM